MTCKISSLASAFTFFPCTQVVHKLAQPYSPSYRKPLIIYQYLLNNTTFLSVSLLLRRRMNNTDDASPNQVSVTTSTVAAKVNPPSNSSPYIAQNEDPSAVKPIIRRVDWRMLPLLGILYAIALIDRTNLGIARTAGMDHDLNLSIGSRYSIISFLYFIPYTLLQFPSNFVLRRLGVNNWLAFCVNSTRCLWGRFLSCTCVCNYYMVHTPQSTKTFQPCRSFRLGTFYLVSILTGGFSPILAYLFTLLDGKREIPAWVWIFISPTKTLLTEEETKVVLLRVERDRGDAVPDDLTFRKALQHLGDWKMWAFGLMYFCATVPAYDIGFFMTMILRSMGWSVEEALLLSAPPYIIASIGIIIFSWLSDKYKQRAIFIAIQTGMTLCGLFLTGFANATSWRYFGIFLTNAGSAGCICHDMIT